MASSVAVGETMRHGTGHGAGERQTQRGSSIGRESEGSPDHKNKHHNHHRHGHRPRLSKEHTQTLKIFAVHNNSTAGALSEHDKQMIEKHAGQGLKPRFIIDPRHSKFSGYWDLVTMLALLFTAVVTPFEVSFLSAPQKWEEVDGLFLVNRLIDLIFIIDLILQFFLMYPEGDPETGVRWVDKRSQIRDHYLKSWFALDFFSILLMAIDFITISSGGGEEEEEEGENDKGALEALRVLRVLRALRLIKLVRLVRASRMFKRWECKIAINYSALAMAKSVIGIVVVSHWFACIFALQTIFFDGPVDMVPVLGTDPPEYVDTWKGKYSYCTATGPRSSSGTVPYECIDPVALYCASLYWAIMTITSIGYGDVAATPRNSAEQAITAVLMLAGGFLWGQVIGTFCGVIATFDPHGAEFRRNMDDLNVFMHNRHLPIEMQRRLREYFHQTKHLQMARSQSHLYGMMSPSLQGEVAWAANKKWLERIPFLKNCGPDFKIELAMALDAKLFAPGEQAPRGNLYVINRGLALYGARLLTAGKIWGDDVILMNPELRSPFHARAMNYLETYTISHEALFAVVSDFPKSRRVVRRCALLMALKRKLMLDYGKLALPGTEASQPQLLMAGQVYAHMNHVELARMDEVDGEQADKDRHREAAFARSMGEMLQGGEVMDDLTESSMRNHTAGPSTVSKHVSDLAAARLDSATAKMSANTSQVVEKKLAAILDLVKSMHDQQQASVERAEASMSALTAKLEELAARQQQFEGVVKGSLKV
jgi:potassium voltage-gated channel Eag-related subfamily H protein 7